MRSWSAAFRVVIGFAGLALLLPAQAQEQAPAQQGPAGLYYTDMPETASVLELSVDGRFAWFLTVGALDLGAEGSWRLGEDGAVRLDTEPPVRPPEVELLGHGTEPGEGLAVRILDESGETPVYLDVSGEYDSDEPGYARLDEDHYRFDAETGRRVVAVRVEVPWTGFRSQRFEVPTGANLVRLRFAPNDIARADFRGERAIIDSEGLTLNVLGAPMRYRRMSAEEYAAYQAAAEAVESAAAAAEASAESDAATVDGMGIPAEELAGTVAGLDDDTLWLYCVNEGFPYPRNLAIAACTELIDRGNQPPEAVHIPYFNRANLLVDDGQFARAIADYDQALRLDPAFSPIYGGRAVAHAGLGDFDASMADFREAMRLQPDDPELLNSFCWRFGIAGRELDQARAACDSSLRLRPEDAPTLDSRGLVGLKQQRYAEAWADYDAAVRLDPQQASFLYGRGIAALRLGRTEEGRADLERASEMDPTIAATYAAHGVEP